MDKKATLLIIDDTPANIDILSALFREKYNIKAALSGRLGLNLIRASTAPDLILLDVVMPEMDGFDVCRQMKKNPDTRSIPIIFITAKTDVGDKVRGFDEGGVDYITKPFEPEEVIARVNTHIELHQARHLIQSYNLELEERLRIRTRELIHSERQAAFGQLVQGIVHNLANPLSGISGNQQLVELMIRQYRKQPPRPDKELTLMRSIIKETEQSYEMIGRSVERLTQIIHSLLAKSRIDKANDLKRVDLNQIIRTEIDFLEADMRFRHLVEKEISLSGEPLFIEAIPAEIAQVFYNLITNALDALGEKPESKIKIVSGTEADRVFLKISDNGPGIPEKIQERIFEPFFTTKPSREANQDNPNLPIGTGLGLWMCQETVRSYGGSITVESTPGLGAAFIFYLPGCRQSGFDAA